MPARPYRVSGAIDEVCRHSLGDIAGIAVAVEAPGQQFFLRSGQHVKVHEILCGCTDRRLLHIPPRLSIFVANWAGYLVLPLERHLCRTAVPCIGSVGHSASEGHAAIPCIREAMWPLEPIRSSSMNKTGFSCLTQGKCKITIRLWSIAKCMRKILPWLTSLWIHTNDAYLRILQKP